MKSKKKIKNIIKWSICGLGWTLTFMAFLGLVILGVRGCADKQRASEVAQNNVTVPIQNKGPHINKLIVSENQSGGYFEDVPYNNSIYGRVYNMMGYLSSTQEKWNHYYYNFFEGGGLYFPDVSSTASGVIGFENFNLTAGRVFDGYNESHRKICYVSYIWSTLTDDNQVISNAEYHFDDISGIDITNNELWFVRTGSNSTLRLSLDWFNGNGVVMNGVNNKITQLTINFNSYYRGTYELMLDGSNGPTSGVSDWKQNLLWYEGGPGVSMDQWFQQSAFSCTNYNGSYVGQVNSTVPSDDPSSGQGGSGSTVGIDGLSGVFNLLSMAFNSMYNFFAIPVIPGVTMGTLIVIPLISIIILFLVKLFKR